MEELLKKVENDPALKPASDLFTEKDGEVHKKHPFFSYYGMLTHQQNMLLCSHRTSTYQDAMLRNSNDFAGKVVMDVGSGSGILSYFAIKAGAKKVYAVEASSVAERSKKLIMANNLQDKIIVLNKKVEEVVLDDEIDGKVDIIISEPMGFMLIHERMLESYIIARKKFLRPNGLMFPTTGTIYATPFSDATIWSDQASKANFWNTKDFYGLDMSCLSEEAMDDHFCQPIVGYIDTNTFISSTTEKHVIDFSKDEPESLHRIVLPFQYTVDKTTICHGLALWFDVSFDGTTESVVLSTGPYAPGTHWYQCRLLLKNPLAVNAGQVISGNLVCIANDRYSYNMVLNMGIKGSEASTADNKPIASQTYVSLADQQYNYLYSNSS